MFSTVIIALIILSILYLYKNEQSSNVNIQNQSSNNLIGKQFMYPVPLDKQTSYPRKILTSEQAWQQKDKLINKEVAVKGIVDVAWRCTDMAGDNGCWGLFIFSFGNLGSIYIGLLVNNETQASCNGVSKTNSGNITDIQCNFLEPGEEYTFVGTLSPWEVYSPIIQVNEVYDSSDKQIYAAI